MRIVIPTIGTRGDVQPFIALAQGLLKAGHSVTLMSHPYHGRLVEGHGIAFAPLGPDIDMGEETAGIRASTRSSAAGLVRVMRFAFDMLEQAHADILAGCRDADLVIVPTASAAGRNEADLLGLPFASVTLMPWSIPWDDPERPLARRALYRAIDGLVALITTRPLNRRRKRVGLAPVGPEGFGSARLDLVPVSPAVYAPNPRWAPQHRVVGYWFADEPVDWQPPAGLLAFLEQGDAPVVISLGAMSLGREGARETAGLLLGAIGETGLRAVVQGWHGGLDEELLPPAVYRAGAMPHGWLLQRAAGIVHHGGFGTTAAGLRAGIPALVIPHIADQFFWGQRVHELSAGPQAIRRSRLDVQRLVAGLTELTQNPSLRRGASEIAERIRTEQGVAAAVRLIEETFG